jgi:signal transduction histidine kinase
MQEALQRLQLHDTELTRDVLLARAGLLPNYDTLPRLGQQLSQTVAALRTESATASDQAAQAMGTHVEALATALHQKLTLVEYFTSDNALLRNSLTYITYTGQTLGTHLEAEPAVAAEIASLSHALLRFIHTPERSVGTEAEAALNRLARLPVLQQELDVLVAHGRLIVAMLPRVDALLRQIIAAPTMAQAEALQHAALQYAIRIEARAQLFRVLPYLVAVLLLGYLLYQFARLRAHARALHRANADLQWEQETIRQQELQLIQANKMTALGTLVSGVAHEINNPNQVVLMNARVLAEAWDDAMSALDTYAQESGTFTLSGLPYTEMRDTIPALVRDMHDGALRIERIIDDLRDFARPRVQGADTVVQVNDAVQRALRLLAHLIKRRTNRLHVVLAQEVPPVPGDPQHVEQIVVNLLTNALEALPDRQCGVTVTTSFDAAEHHVRLEVRDEGVGIPAEHLARLCDPFFTTKQESGGTGLGLAITSSLVRLHGGRLTFASEPGQGTCALVTLPYPNMQKPHRPHCTAG